MVNNGCVFQLDANTYSYVANSNAGGEPVKLTVSGSDDAATGFGDSAPFQLQFSQGNVEGGLYYWTVSNNTGTVQASPGFWLPFQDLNTSNHIGQWTQKIVIGPG